MYRFYCFRKCCIATTFQMPLLILPFWDNFNREHMHVILLLTTRKQNLIDISCRFSFGNLHEMSSLSKIAFAVCVTQHAKRLSEAEQKRAQRKDRAKTSPTELSSSDLYCATATDSLELRLVSSANLEHTNNNTSRIWLGLVIVSNDTRTYIYPACLVLTTFKLMKIKTADPFCRSSFFFVLYYFRIGSDPFIILSMEVQGYQHCFL